MDRPSEATPDGPGWLERWLGRLAFAALLVANGALTFALFDFDLDKLTDDRPICVGQHALHLYHGHLGARGFKKRLSTTVYDPHFCAGYVKTPWFDAGSRPAELFLSLRGGEFQPGAYKMGLAVCLWGGPFLLGWAAALFRAPRPARWAAILLGICLCQSELVRARLWTGDVDLIMAALLAPVFLAFAWRYHSRGTLLSWLGLAGSGAVLLFLHPLVLAGTVPALMALYVAAGWRHGVAWQGGLLTALAISLLANWHWLQSAVGYWWVWTGGQGGASDTSTLPGLLAVLGLARHPIQLMLLGLLLVVGGLGLAPAPAPGRPRRQLGLVLLTFLAAALFGHHWPVLSGSEPVRYLVVAAAIACVPAGELLVTPLRALLSARRSAVVRVALRPAAALLAVVLMGASASPPAGALLPEPLPVGLPDPARRIIALLREQTTIEARILWEEDAESAAWLPLLPYYTRRFFVGGPSPNACVEHAAVRLAEGRLAGRPLAAWSGGELSFRQFCRRFNVGWVVCREEATRRWLASQPQLVHLTETPDGRHLFAVQRETEAGGKHFSGYVLRGSARLARCDDRLITLVDLVPENGQILLSFHYHAEIAASSERVRLNKEPDPFSSVPLLRLHLPGPMTRLTLRWQE